MKKIRYTENAVYKVIADYEFKTINTPDGSFIRYLIIYTVVNNFMEYNPPCKKCLIQSMCLEDISDLLDEFVGFQIRSCSLLKEFIIKEQKKFNHI